MEAAEFFVRVSFLSPNLTNISYHITLDIIKLTVCIVYTWNYKLKCVVNLAEILTMSQLSLPINLNYREEIPRSKLIEEHEEPPKTYLDKLILLLSQDLNFCNNNNLITFLNNFH